jgi:hypothetical protein
MGNVGSLERLQNHTVKPNLAKGGHLPKERNNNWDNGNYLSFKPIHSHKRSKDKLITLQLGGN